MLDRLFSFALCINSALQMELQMNWFSKNDSLSQLLHLQPGGEERITEKSHRLINENRLDFWVWRGTLVRVEDLLYELSPIQSSFQKWILGLVKKSSSEKKRWMKCDL